MIKEWRKQLRPLYFSGPVQTVVRRTNRLLSPLLFNRKAKERLRTMFCRLPKEFATPALANLEKVFELCIEGRGLGPHAHFELSRWLSGKPLSSLRAPTPSLGDSALSLGAPASSLRGSEGAEATFGPVNIDDSDNSAARGQGLLRRCAPRNDGVGSLNSGRSTLNDEGGTKKLKILFVTGCFPSVRHGGGLRVFDLIQSLSNKHEVSLYSFYEGEDEETLQKLLPSLHSVRLVPQTPFSNEDFLSWIRSRTEIHFDAIHFVWPETALLMPSARPFAGQLVFEFIESMTRKASLDLMRMLETLDANHSLASARPVYDLWRSFFLENLGCQMADSTISLTSVDEAFAEQLFPSGKGNLIPQCVSDSEVWNRLSQSIPPPENYEALFLGFFQHTPNIDGLAWYLKEIHPRVKRAIKEYRLVVAGDGAAEKVRAIIGDDKTVQYKGRFEDLVSVIAASKVCLAPLISGSGIRGKVNQYSAVGRPTVTTSIGATGLPYVSGESIFIADSPGEFAERVIRLFRDETVYESMRLKAKEIVGANFRTSAIIPKLEALYAT